VLVVDARRLHLEQRQPPLPSDGARDQRLVGPLDPEQQDAAARLDPEGLGLTLNAFFRFSSHALRCLKPPTSARFSSGETYSSTLSLRSISFLISTMRSMSLASSVLSRRIACVIARSASKVVKPRSRSTSRSR